MRHRDDVWRSSFLASFIDSLCRVKNKIMYVSYSCDELFRRSLECYFCCTTREINTKITLSWAPKQFATRVHTLFYMCIYSSLLDVIIHPCHKFNWGWDKSPLKLGYCQGIYPTVFIWILILILPLNSMLVKLISNSKRGTKQTISWIFDFPVKHRRFHYHAHTCKIAKFNVYDAPTTQELMR